MVSVIIPTYNEKENIKLLVERLNKSLDSYPHEIIIVDDDSNDGTVETIESLAAGYPVRVIERKNKRGIASAVVDGIKEAAGDTVVVMDADLQHPPEVVPELLRALKDHGLVVGSRFCRGGSAGERTIFQKLVSAMANWLAFPLARKVKDRLSGFFAFHREDIKPDSLNRRGWKIGLEVMVCGQYRQVVEVPYTCGPRQRGSSKSSRRAIWQYLLQLILLYLNKYQISNFMIVGGIGYALNMLVYSLLTLNIHTSETIFLGQHFYLVPFVVSSLLAIICNYIFNKIWTFRGWAERRLGGLRYLIMALATLILDMFFLGLLVDKGKMSPIPAAALAILIVFVLRFAIARRWIWSRR
jgi:dolichol-phosphate mannosyltransferase